MGFESEALKFFGILCIGAFIIIVGLYVHHRNIDGKRSEKHTYKPKSITSSSYSPNMSSNEESAKNYIMNYKKSYTIQSMRVALIKQGNDESHVDYWLKKYGN